jgi:hypothetical protein
VGELGKGLGKGLGRGLGKGLAILWGGKRILRKLGLVLSRKPHVAGLLADWLGRKKLMKASGVLFVLNIPMIALAAGNQGQDPGGNRRTL